MNPSRVGGQGVGGRRGSGVLWVGRGVRGAAALAIAAGIAACGGDGATESTPACGPGTTLKNGACAPACGSGTVFDAATGSCVAGTSGSGGSSGGSGAGGAAGGAGGAMGGSGGDAGAGGQPASAGGTGGAAGQAGGAAGASGTAGAAGASGGKSGYCPPVIDINCDPVCGAVHPACKIGSCAKSLSFDVSAGKQQYVVQLPTALSPACCQPYTERRGFDVFPEPGATAAGYRMSFPDGHHGWTFSFEIFSAFCIAKSPSPGPVCASPKLIPAWTFGSELPQMPPTTVVFEKTKDPCP